MRGKWFYKISKKKSKCVFIKLKKSERVGKNKILKNKWKNIYKGKKWKLFY